MRQKLQDKLNDNSEEFIRRIRLLEKQNAELRSKAASLENKWKQAENDLLSAEQRAEILTDTSHQILTHTYSKLENRPKGQATAIICANDWHVEEKVDPTTCNDQNKFDLKIAEQRIEKLWKKSVYWLDHSRKISDVRDCVLWLGGDFISGYIHDELEENNLLSPTQAILFIQSHIIGGIEYLFKHGKIDSLTVVCNFGNHGRTTKKMRFATGYMNSYEWMAYNNLATYFKSNNKINFYIASGYHSLIDIQGWKIRFHHGDAIRYWGGVGGITIPVNKAIAQWNKSLHADWDIFGHWHQFHRDWKWVSCGCLIGFNAYAIQVKADYQPPTQTFLVVDKKRGLVTAEPIFVT